MTRDEAIKLLYQLEQRLPHRPDYQEAIQCGYNALISGVIKGEPVADMSVTQVANYFRVSRRTIYNWIEDGKFDVAYTPGGSPRLTLKDSLLT